MAQLDEIVGQKNIAQVITLDKALIDLDETYKKVFLSSQQAVSGINDQITSYTKLQAVQTQTATQSKALNEAEKEAGRIAKEQAATLAALDKQRQAAYKRQAADAQKAYDAAQKQAAKEKELADAINMEVKSINDARKQNEALTKARNALNLKTSEGKKQAEAYNKIIDKNTEYIRANADAATKQKMTIGDYGTALKGIGTKIMGFAASLGIAIGAVDLLKKGLEASEAAADWWAEKTEGLKQGFNYLARSIGSVDFGTLISGFRDAFKEGERYAGVLDEIEARHVEMGIKKADIEGQILDQKKIAKAAWSTKEEKEAAIDEILRLSKSQMEEEKANSDKNVNNELDNAAQLTNVNRDLIQSYVSNYSAYEEKIKEGAALQKQLQSLISVTQLKSGGYIRDYSEYDKAVAKLTDDQKELLDINKLENSLTQEKRELIGAALTEQIGAVNTQKEAELGLSKLRNSLYNEYIKDAKEADQAIIESAKKAANEKIRAEGLANQSIKIDNKTTNDEIISGIKTTVTANDPMSNGLFQHQQAYYDRLNELSKAAHEEELKRAEEEKEAKMKAAQTYVNAVAEYGGQLFEINQMLIDKETAKMEESKAYELQMAGDNVAKREAIEKKYDKEATKLKQKQAKQDKAQALFNAIVKTAQAVLAGLAFGPPLGYVFAALNAVLGAVQIGIIASQPIPQFAKGTENAPDGVISVAEKGKELIKTRSGKVLLAKKPTLLAGMKGAKIFTNEQTEALLAMQNVGYDSKELRQTLDRNNRDLIRAIRDKREVHITPPRGSRITEREGSYFKTYLDKKINR